jgi:hypothetical protein
VVDYQPFYWFTATPLFLSHQTSTFWLLEYVFLLIALSPATR